MERTHEGEVREHACHVDDCEAGTFGNLTVKILLELSHASLHLCLQAVEIGDGETWREKSSLRSKSGVMLRCRTDVSCLGFIGGFVPFCDKIRDPFVHLNFRIYRCFHEVPLDEDFLNTVLASKQDIIGTCGSFRISLDAFIFLSLQFFAL